MGQRLQSRKFSSLLSEIANPVAPYYPCQSQGEQDARSELARLRGRASGGTGREPAARTPPSRPKTKAPASKKGKPIKWREKSSPELRKAAEQATSRAEALQVLFRPLQEAGQSELQRTKSGRKLRKGPRDSSGVGQLQERIVGGEIPFEEGRRLTRERNKAFRERTEDPLVDALAPHVRLQPSVEAVAQVLRPEMASRTTWVSETSFLRAMLLQPKRTFEDVGTVQQGLGDPPPPPVVQSCVTSPVTASARWGHFMARRHQDLFEAGSRRRVRPRCRSI